MNTRLVAELPKFDTGQYTGSEFIMSGRDAKLTLRFSALPAFEIHFSHIRWHQFTAVPSCSAEMIEGAYFRLVELTHSGALTSFIERDRAPTKAYKELHHYRIFLEDTGCHEVFAESADAGQEG